MHQFLGFELNWDTGNRYKLLLWGCKCVLGTALAAITPEILLFIFSLPCGHFLVAFFFFLCKSNPIVEQSTRFPQKVPLCSDLLFSSNRVKLRIPTTKMIQFNQ